MNEKLIILGKASVKTAEKRQCLALILKKMIIPGKDVWQRGLRQRNGVNRGKSCGMQVMIGKEETVWNVLI